MENTKQFRQKFISKTDPDITIEINEEQMIPKKISFSQFYTLYQGKHKSKYGKILIVR